MNQIALLLVIPLLAGCAYTVGPVNGSIARDKSVQINPFLNQTLEPRLTETVTAQLRKQFQQDGTYRLVTHGPADIIISGTITNYSRHEMNYARTDTLTVKDYRLSLTAQVTAMDPVARKVIVEKPVTGYTLIRVGSDLTSSERQA